MKWLENSKLDKTGSKAFFCLGEKLDVEAKLHGKSKSNWQVLRRVLLGQPSLLCLRSCDGTCTVGVQSLGFYFGHSIKGNEWFLARIFILESSCKFGWWIILHQTVGYSRFVR